MITARSALLRTTTQSPSAGGEPRAFPEASFLLLSCGKSRLARMSVPDASTPARDAIDAFLRHLADRGLSATTRRIRKTYLNEYLRHAQQAAAELDEADG